MQCHSKSLENLQSYQSSKQLIGPSSKAQASRLEDEEEDLSAKYEAYLADKGCVSEASLILVNAKWTDSFIVLSALPEHSKCFKTV